MTRRLREKSGPFNHVHNSDLEHLRVTAHHRHSRGVPYFRTEDFDRYQAVFYTLVELDYPQYIRHFLENGLDDQKLPIPLEDLKRIIQVDDNGFLQKFAREQYRWCPLVFDLNMNNNGFRPDRIIPLCRKEKIEPRRGIYKRHGHISTLWKVEVPDELITNHLRDRVMHSKIQRKVEGTDDESVVVSVTYIDFTSTYGWLRVSSITNSCSSNFRIKSRSTEKSTWRKLSEATKVWSSTLVGSKAARSGVRGRPNTIISFSSLERWICPKPLGCARHLCRRNKCWNSGIK